MVIMFPFDYRVRNSARFSPMITAILPTTAKDISWVRAGLLSCNNFLTPQNGIAEILYVVPREDVYVFQRTLIAQKSNWRVISEDDFVPELRGTHWPGAHKQQVIKLLSYRNTTTPILLFLDSDTLCNTRWTAHPAVSLQKLFVQPSKVVSESRVKICSQATAQWFGTQQYRRTSAHWGITLQHTRVMGWTPQLLSRRGLEQAVQHLQNMREVDLHGLFFRQPNYSWTEYATYFLSLQDAGLWKKYHVESIPFFDIDGGGQGVGQQISGCLHVRVNSIGDLQRVLQEDPIVPFIMVDDHHVNSTLIEEFLRFSRFSSDDMGAT